MMICKSCGNTDQFERIESGTAFAERTVLVNGNTQEEIEIKDEIVTAWDNTDDIEELTCNSCESDIVEEDLNQEEIDKIRYEHTDKLGEWSEDPLPDDQRNEELKQTLVAKQV